ncbi:MAG: nucleotide exchange factor GrpE [Candidatus Thorarchaeota archaeon]|jgi:molecular chaperone GrpE
MQEKREDESIEVDLTTEDEEDDFELIPWSKEDDIEVAEVRSKELFDRFQRLQAEFDNYRKRMESRFSDAAQFASEGILLKVLDVYDNLERALEVDFAKDPKAAKEGVGAIEKQVRNLLEREGVKPKESKGMPFDPYYQHAVGTENDTEKPDGIIVDVFQKGYMIKEKVLRPALVVVNRHELPPDSGGQDDTVDEKSEVNGDE